MTSIFARNPKHETFAKPPTGNISYYGSAIYKPEPDNPHKVYKASGSTTRGDRFIPCRGVFDTKTPVGVLDCSPVDMNISGSDSEGSYNTKCSDCAYKALIHENFQMARMADSKVLHFSGDQAEPSSGSELSSTNKLCTSLSLAYQKAKETVEEYKKAKRRVPHKPERILDAPEILDDYYLNLLDWSAANKLAVCLGHSLYIWDAATGGSQHLLTHDAEHPWNVLTAVSWAPHDNLIAVGGSDRTIKIWDAAAMKYRAAIPQASHEGRISALAWNNRNGNILASGSRDSYIIQHDMRVLNKPICKLHGHTQEVCGLKWSPEGMQLASGGNDNCLCVWDLGTTMPRFSRANYHNAAVKAISWCPWQSHLFATGGGTADKCIKMWDSATGECVKSFQTESQICAILFNPHEKELISSHGFTSNQITIWRYPSMESVAELKGHKSRVLYMAMSPDGGTIVSASADETLRFWRINSPTKTTPNKRKKKSDLSCLNEAQLR